jgi:hypothetical protein
MNGVGNDWFLRIARDADLGRPDRRLRIVEVDCDICRECGEHAEFEQDDDGTRSTCCGAGVYRGDE